MWVEPELVEDSCLPHWQAWQKSGCEMEGSSEVPMGSTIGSRLSPDAAD